MISTPPPSFIYKLVQHGNPLVLFTPCHPSSYHLPHALFFLGSYGTNPKLLIHTPPPQTTPPYHHWTHHQAWYLLLQHPPHKIQCIQNLQPHLIHPSERKWLPPDIVQYHVKSQTSLDSITVLEADVQGVPRFFGGCISQGRGIAHNSDFKFIWEEIGRWPTDWTK